MIPTFTGRIVEWDRAKGWGWINTQGQRIFLQRREFAERHKQPAVGDMIRFTAGTDTRGRICAKTAVHVNDGGRFTISNLTILLALLGLPGSLRHVCHPVFVQLSAGMQSRSLWSPIYSMHTIRVGLAPESGECLKAFCIFLN